MQSTGSPRAIAARAFVASLAQSRSSRRRFWVGGLALLVLAGAASLADLGGASSTVLRRQVLVPGVPVLALLLGDLALRDGLQQKTLLHDLLGPVPRSTLALVRGGITAVLAGLLALVVAASFGVATLSRPEAIAREALAAALGGFAYAGISVALHTFLRRAFIAGLLGLFLVDILLGALPLALRNAAPSAHLLLLAGYSPANGIGEVALPFAVAAPSAWLSIAVLVSAGTAGLLLAAWRFARMDLPELA
jgi:hypothetical protein